MADKQIHELTALPSTLTTGNVFAVDTGENTYKIDYDALATAIISKLGGDPVTLAHGGTGATTKGAARVGIGIKYAIYNGVADLGLTSGTATILTAFDAMGDNAILIAASDDFVSSARPGGATGIVEIIRKADSRTYIAFHGKNGGNSRDWRMFENAVAYNDNRANAPDGVWHPDFAGLRGGTGSSGTTLSIDVPNNSSHLLVMNGNGNQRLWAGVITVYSTGNVTATEIKKGTDTSIATATNKVTITCSSGTELAFMCLPIRGNPFTGYTIS